MENEKFGVELQLITESFTSKLKELKKGILDLQKTASRGITVQINEGVKKQATEFKKTVSKIKKTQSDVFDAGDVTGIQFSGLMQRDIKGFSSNKNLIGSKEDLANAFEYQRALENIGNTADIVNQKLSSTKFKRYDTEAIQEFVNNYGQKTNEIKNDTDEVTQKISFLNSLKLRINTSGLAEAIEKTKGKLNGLKSKIAGVKDSFSKGFSKMQNTVGKFTKSIKRFGLALLGIRSLFAVVSRASSAYLSQDTELANKMQAVWTGLGSLLAPILEKIADLSLKIVSYVNGMVKAFTGIDLIAKASSKAISQTGKSAEKANKSLAGFDELTNINQDTGSASGTATNPFKEFENLDVSDINLIDKFNQAMENIDWNKIQITAQKMALNFSGRINDAFSQTNWSLLGSTIAQGLNTALIFADTIYTSTDFKQIGKSFSDTLNGFADDFDWNLFGKTIGDGLVGAFDTASGFLQNIDVSKWLDGFAETLKGVDWSKVASSMAEMLGSAVGATMNIGVWIGNAISKGLDDAKKYFEDKIDECGGNVVEGILKGILDAIKGIGQWVNDNIFQPFIDGFKKAFKIHSPSQIMEDMGGFIIDGLKKGLEGIWSKVKGAFTDFIKEAEKKFNEFKKWIEDNIINPIKNKFSDIWGKIKEKIDGFITNVKTGFGNFKTWINDNVITKIKNLFSDIWGKIKEKIDGFINNVQSALGKFKGWIDENVTSKISSLFTGIWDTISTKVGGFVGTIKDKLKGMKDWIKTNVTDKISGFFSGIWDNMSTTFSNVWNTIKTAFSKGGEMFVGIKDGIVDTFKNIVNNLITGINKIIKTPFQKLNNVLNTMRNASILGVKPFSKLWRENPLPVPQIPKLNVGTNYVPEDQLAYIHKGEAVIPKKFNSKEYFNKNDDTKDILVQVLYAIKDIEINPYTTIKDVGDASLNYINKKARLLGESVV